MYCKLPTCHIAKSANLCNNPSAHFLNKCLCNESMDDAILKCLFICLFIHFICDDIIKNVLVVLLVITEHQHFRVSFFFVTV